MTTSVRSVHADPGLKPLLAVAMNGNPLPLDRTLVALFQESDKIYGV